MYRISKEETGMRLRELMVERGVTVREIQEQMGLESPQAVYKWLNGKAVPNTENLYILSRLLNVSMEEIIVAEDDPVVKARERAWKTKHPLVFLAYKIQEAKTVRDMDLKRFSHFLEDMMQERMRTIYCME